MRKTLAELAVLFDPDKEPCTVLYLLSHGTQAAIDDHFMRPLFKNKEAVYRRALELNTTWEKVLKIKEQDEH